MSIKKHVNTLRDSDDWKKSVFADFIGDLNSEDRKPTKRKDWEDYIGGCPPQITWYAGRCVNVFKTLVGCNVKRKAYEKIKLNKQQKSVAEDTDGYSVVYSSVNIKTKSNVLAKRICSILNKGVDPSRVLVLSSSEFSSSSVLYDLRGELKSNPGVDILSFDSFCKRFVEESELGSKFKKFMPGVWSNLELVLYMYSKLGYIEKLKASESDLSIATKIVELGSNLSALIDSAVSEVVGSQGSSLHVCSNYYNCLLKPYNVGTSDLTIEDCISYKKEIGVLTFEELYLLTLMLLQQGVSIPSYDYIIIDEIQDFTELQAVILRSLVSNCKNVSFVEEQRYKTKNSLTSERVLNVGFKKLFLVNEPVVPERQVYYTNIVDYSSHVILDYVNQGYSLDDIAHNHSRDGYIYSHVVPTRALDDFYLRLPIEYTNGMIYSLILYLSDSSDEIIKFLAFLRFFMIHESSCLKNKTNETLEVFIKMGQYTDSFSLLGYLSERFPDDEPITELLRGVMSADSLYNNLCLPESIDKTIAGDYILFYLNEISSGDFLYTYNLDNFYMVLALFCVCKANKIDFESILCKLCKIGLDSFGKYSTTSSKDVERLEQFPVVLKFS